MEIDFNHLRRKTGREYNELVRFLQKKNNEGIICFDDSEIEEILFDMRSSIGAILNTYEPNDRGFKCLHDDPFLLVFETFEGSLVDEADYHAQ